ncbi:LuxR C-terminal-related transcriptional regulator [Streptomyces gamaensis]|uniref:LuxR C-terminal-related transcriptional regulator n=1 Tax=Streptomyces gamaensis TaxID=1763542 RepID=A0ABW0Z7F3_9ACTN
MKVSLTTGTDLDDQLTQLTAAEIALYRRIVTEGPLEIATLASDGRPEETDPAVDKLIALGLVRRLGADRLAAVDPADVSDRLLQGWEERVQCAHLDLLWARGQLAELGLIYDTQQHPAQGAQFERVESFEDVMRTMARQVGESREEVLSSLPGGPRSAMELPGSRDWERDLLGRGVRLRTLYQHAARFHPPTVAYAEEVTGLGADVRTITGNLARFVVFDREVLVVPLRGTPKGVVVVRNEAVVTFAVEMFNRLWAVGEPITKPNDKTFVQDLANQTKRSILQYLIDGADDRATARALGISVRTCQRHVSEIMRSLGASSRLQLGYLLREKGMPEGLSAA